MADVANPLNAADVRERLRAACAEAGGQKRWGREHGFSQQYVGEVISGRRAPSDRILRGLGLQAETVFLPRAPEEVAFYDADGVTLFVAERVFD